MRVRVRVRGGVRVRVCVRVRVRVHVFKCRNAELSGIRSVRYRTRIIDAGMPMPALVSSMPMPSYAMGNV